MSDAKERRAKQTVNNLLLSLLATVGLVIFIVLVVPRDDSSRIPKIDYVSVAQQASISSKHEIVAPTLPTGWWSNQATWLANPVDAVPRFEVGFVGPKNEFIGMTQAFGVNPTWLALETKDVVLLNTFSNPGSSIVWSIFKSADVHEPALTKDVIWLASVGTDAIELYGTASDSQFKVLSKNIETELENK